MTNMKPILSKEIVSFIKSDIERELRLARLSRYKWYKLIIAKILHLPTGGGNFVAALALLCYTEYFGKELIKNSSKKNFDFFFAKLGTDYKNLLAQHRIYDIFRCGLAHEFWIKKSGTIFMFGSRKPALGFDKNGYAYFVVEQYYKDLMVTVYSEFDIC